MQSLTRRVGGGIALDDTATTTAMGTTCQLLLRQRLLLSLLRLAIFAAAVRVFALTLDLTAATVGCLLTAIVTAIVTAIADW